MSQKRLRYRENKKKRKLEEKLLSRKNEFGFNDPTAFLAIRSIIEKEKKIRGEQKE